MGHEHNVRDSDARFIIDPVTMGIKNNYNKKITLIQFDHNSERLTFEIPKEIDTCINGQQKEHQNSIAGWCASF